MHVHSPTSVLICRQGKPSALDPLIAYLESLPHMRLTLAEGLPAGFQDNDVVVTPADSSENTALLEDFVHSGGGWLTTAGESARELPEPFGVRLHTPGPEAELRVLFKDADHPLAVRLPDALYIQGRHRPLELCSDAAEVVLYADWHYRHIPVLVKRPWGEGEVACTTLTCFDHPVLQQIFYRLLRSMSGRLNSQRSLGVGIVGYATFGG